jgi:hypothetical protein
VKNPVFVSYAREDAGFALRLAGDLKEKGANVWLDQLDIRPGRQWDREVERALSMCNEMLVVLSPAAIDSNNVMDEVAFALDERKTVIPILHGECRLPFRLRRLQYIDLKSDYEQGLQQLLITLAQEEQIASAAAATGVAAPTVVQSNEGEQQRIERENTEAAERALEAAEAKRKAEEEQRTLEAAEARRKTEEEQRAREAAQAKRKAEEDQRALEAAEARRKAEEDQRARDAVEARRKAEEEQRAREAAEAKRRAEDEQRAHEAAQAQREVEKERRITTDMRSRDWESVKTFLAKWLLFLSLTGLLGYLSYRLGSGGW